MECIDTPGTRVPSRTSLGGSMPLHTAIVVVCCFREKCLIVVWKVPACDRIEAYLWEPSKSILGNLSLYIPLQQTTNRLVLSPQVFAGKDQEVRQMFSPEIPVMIPSCGIVEIIGSVTRFQLLGELLVFLKILIITPSIALLLK